MNVSRASSLGLVVTVTIIALIFVSYRITDLPLVRSDREVHAEFADAGNLKSGDDVVISGTQVGTVDDMVVREGKAYVTFTLDTDFKLGDTSSARIVTQTLLGAAALEVIPGGQGNLERGDIIPVERTRSPYDLTQALSELTTTSQDIDTQALTEALDQITTTFDGTPADLRGALQGLSKVASTLDRNDTALSSLLDRASKVSGVLADRNEQVATLLTSGDSLLAQLNARQDVIVALLKDATELSRQLSALIDENRRELKPALEELDDVVDLLNSNKVNLEKTIEAAGSYATELGEAVTTGPFFDAYVQNLTSLQTVTPVLSGLLP